MRKRLKEHNTADKRVSRLYVLRAQAHFLRGPTKQNPFGTDFIDFGKAHENLDAALAINPRCADAFYWRGRLFAQANDFPTAIACYTQAITSGNRGDFYYHRGQAFERIGHRQSALGDYKQAYESFGEHAEAKKAFRTSGCTMTNDTRLHRLYNSARLADREVNELLGLTHGITADGVITQAEVEYLHKWLVAHTAGAANPVVAPLLGRVATILADGIVDPEEAADLFALLQRFAAGDFEVGEMLKATTLPLDAPPPSIRFPESRFCFTGTFAFGTSKECQAAVEAKGSQCGSLTQETGYLVIGIYATDSWAHSTFGRKIEKAVALREKGLPIAIIGEQHWVAQLRA
jgi:tetratricopeptide (TPR) repeat protein